MNSTAKRFTAVFVGVGVLVLVGLLLIPSIRSPVEGSKRSMVQNDANTIAFAIKLFSEDAAGQLPPSENSALVNVLSGKNTLKREYFKFKQGSVDQSGNFLDPWGEPYRFEFTNYTVRVYSRRLSTPVIVDW